MLFLSKPIVYPCLDSRHSIVRPREDFSRQADELEKEQSSQNIDDTYRPKDKDILMDTKSSDRRNDEH